MSLISTPPFIIDTDLLVFFFILAPASFAARVRILSNLALSNFIIPTLFSIVQLVFLFRIGDANPFLLNEITLVNARVAVFGVVFATVWAGKEHRRAAGMALDPFPVEREQQCIHELDRWRVGSHPSLHLANTEYYQSDHVSSTRSEKDTGNIQDGDVVEGRDFALLPPHTSSASRDLRTSQL
ncbi:hypothetical protein OG21DRAFT_584646 [Imleria badia]|nr:hypothetical protein OG21DRAFT_584646 [Imleria badia]